MSELFEVETATTTSLDLRRLQREQRRRMRRARTLVATAVGLVLVAIGGSLSWNWVQSLQPPPSVVEDYEGAGQGSVRIIVEKGDTGDVIAKKLFDKDVVKSKTAFINAAIANPESANIAPGYYQLQKQMKATFALQALLDSGNREEITLSIPEGWNSDQIVARVAAVTEYTEDDVRAALADSAAIGLPEEAGGDPEGWLFPATYKFNPDVLPADVFRVMVQTTVDRLTNYGVERNQWLRTLTFASLVQKEARLDDDFPMVAGVIKNRLAIDKPLQLDSTVHFITKSSGNVSTSEEDRKSDSPYNTYKVIGLPPGPIASPGDLAIKSALNPAEHDFLFFVTIDPFNGTTLYAKTYNQHLKNVQKLYDWYDEHGQ